MNTKKYLLAAFLSLAIGALVATSASAATLSLSPAVISATKGADVTVKIMLDPQGSNVYTAKAEIDFPKNLSVESFTLGNNWMGLTQTGYDLTDNANGILIKSAGYPGGISTPATLGTIVFYAKASGSGAISFGPSSLVYDANSQNVLTGSSPAKLAISAPAVKPAVQPANPVATTEPAATVQPVEPIVSQPVATTEPVQTAVPQQPASLLSAFGNVLTLGTEQFWVGAVVLILLLVILGYAIAFLTRKKETQA